MTNHTNNFKKTTQLAKGTYNVFSHTRNTPLAFMVSHRCYMAVASGAIPSTGNSIDLTQ